MDSINNYYIEVEHYISREQLERDIILEYRKAISHILDGAVLLSMIDSASNFFSSTRPANNVALLTTEANTINPVKSLAAQVDQRNKANMTYLNRLLRSNNRLIVLIREEYKIH